MSLDRPALPPDFDQSRARERAADPTGWRFEEPERRGLYHAIEARRDIRRFRPDPLDPAALERILAAAHAAPSVGLMQPWRFITVTDPGTLAAMQAIAQRERLTQAPFLDERAGAYLDLKLEGIREAPLNLCVCCDRRPGEEILGRHTIPDTDLYSTCLAIENLWLAARAEGVGVGWVSFYDEGDVRTLLGMPAHVIPVAWLCLGYPDERPTRPGLEAAGWGRRSPLADHIFSERWPAPAPPAEGAAPRDCGVSAADLSGPVRPGEHRATLAIRDRSDELIKPPGSLGALESLLERWAAVTGGPPPAAPRAAILVLAADHGVAAHGTSLYPSRVSGQVAAAAARGESAIGVLARTLGARLVVADIGLRGPRQPGLRDLRVREGTADICTGPAMTAPEFARAHSEGERLAADLCVEADVLVLGEIGIANTTAASAVLAGLLGLPAEAVCGRGAGLDAQGVAHKATVVAAAVAANAPDPRAPLEVLRELGGLEFAALAGAIRGAAVAGTPILLDGFAVGVAALAAVRADPTLRDYLFAGHRSAEPAHAIVLRQLGLEPLLDQRLRLGEASGAALALPLIGLAGALHAEMGTFTESGVDRAGRT
ncbi:nicotinate-nucleotide--dimethylbenzimidazole phosphoribosyltransferase [Conexibacter sp. DBS9H8]|uniref:nicotinate-nucleotide--dimethylbenzimidazole phosphoribosyltransferase n=1 Tax=Conexibacter sp. DBS9H8 TaxID=2937801 RepID=UPI00200C0080|nr:nicotinate-nucleotide--dimethylbenzimidazole phosphoribosyltransferase [Conexibacter sp. DBS9H8]